MNNLKKAIFLLILLAGVIDLFAQSDTVSQEDMKIEILKANHWYMANQLDLQGYNFGNGPLNQELYAAAMSKKKSNKKQVQAV